MLLSVSVLQSCTIRDSSPSTSSGLNYLRLADKTILAPLDKTILGVQAAMHLFTIIGIEQLPPRLLSGLLLSLIGAGSLLN